MDEDRNAPATKGDLCDGCDLLSAEIVAVKEELLAAICKSRREIVAAFEEAAQDIRDRAVLPIQAETAHRPPLESWILGIEKRLNIPPSAA